MAKEFFDQNKVEYTNYDVQSDIKRRQEMMDKSGQMGVPVIAIADEKGKEDIVIGFDQAMLIDLLGL